ncbi:MAG TPA: SurA N-terminal domain-containing protein [Chloroflexota bacterium]|nr:SurA N-terminal domain-containing protein [Chloroflexota bacterium]
MNRLSQLGYVVAALIVPLAVAACSSATPDSAAVVNGQAVPMRFYDSMVTVSKRRAEEVGIPIVWDSEAGAQRLNAIQTGTIKRLVQNAVVEQVAKQRAVTVSDTDLDASIGKIEVAFGGPTAVAQRLKQNGMSQSDFRELYRYFLLDQKLRQADPSGYQAALDQAIKTAKVQVFVAPCTVEHDYDKCVGTSAQ